MAIFQCQIQIIKRSEGRSAVAAAAYRAAEKIENEYTGIVEDYSRKNWVEHSEIMLPENAPAEFRNRSVLWNAVEKSEKSKNARLAREVICSVMPVLWSLNHQALPCWILPTASLLWKQPMVVPIAALSIGLRE